MHVWSQDIYCNQVLLGQWPKKINTLPLHSACEPGGTRRKVLKTALKGTRFSFCGRGQKWAWPEILLSIPKNTKTDNFKSDKDGSIKHLLPSRAP